MVIIEPVLLSETVGAFGTIAKYIAGINDTEEFTDYPEYVDYGAVHHTHYVTPHDPHQHGHERGYQEYPDYYHQYQDARWGWDLSERLY